MEQGGFIVGIDFGTSKIVGVLGRKNEQGIISILASESIPSDSCIRHGVIYNIKEAAGKFRKIINLLENQVGKKIGKVYVSIAGKSLRAVEHAEIKHLETESSVTFLDIDKMEQNAKRNKPDFFTNYSVMAPEYFLDGIYEEDPIGKMANTIEGRYRLIIGRPNIKNNIQKSVTEQLGIEIASYIVGPVATGVMVLEEADRQAGCALIDFGAGTTTLSIYKDGMLKYMSVVPFGGRTITKDIQALGFVFDSAEEYKKRYGRIGNTKQKQVRPDSPDVDLRELNKVIQLRQDEIILNVMSQINESEYENQLDAGVLVTGGASMLTGLLEHLEDKLKLPVKSVVPKRVYINNAAELMQNPVYTQALSLLIFANENCERKKDSKGRYEEQTVKSAQPVVQQPIQPVVQEPVVQQAEPVQAASQQPAQAQSAQAVAQPAAEETKKTPSKGKNGILGLFEKIQNFGGTMFNEED